MIKLRINFLHTDTSIACSRAVFSVGKFTLATRSRPKIKKKLYPNFHSRNTLLENFSTLSLAPVQPYTLSTGSMWSRDVRGERG